MPRLHLFEFEDQAWFPASFRRAMTGYLATTYGITPFPKSWADRLAPLLSKDRVAEIVDLGSGAGGPIARVVADLESRGFRVHVTLTDLFPNPQGVRTGGSIRYWPEAVHATCVPSSLAGIRTMFAAFHHLTPEAAQGILRDAFEQRRAICVFEATSRTPGAIASVVLIPLLVLFLTPLVRPVSWVQLLFTYLVPILPLLMFWDGLVSQIRTYSVDELKGLTRDLESADYQWDIGLLEIPRMPAGVPYLVGHPR